ncbi:MAG: radical SAM protein, partial [Myxococcales bacterium]|nr:radical SAM protein [Myxococcales bacterium]
MPHPDAPSHAPPHGRAGGHPGGHPHAEPDDRTVFDDGPRRVYWELTRACSLACLHCRAEAQPTPASDELNTEEVKAVMRQLGAPDKPPMVVLTGGDPLERPDFWQLLDYANEIQLPISVAP